jgi:predicted amidohydrolase YtcJ
VVLSEDPTTCPPDKIKDIRVEATIIGGRIVFKNV